MSATHNTKQLHWPFQKSMLTHVFTEMILAYFMHRLSQNETMFAIVETSWAKKTFRCVLFGMVKTNNTWQGANNHSNKNREKKQKIGQLIVSSTLLVDFGQLLLLRFSRRSDVGKALSYPYRIHGTGIFTYMNG